jgi:ferredoxin
LIWLNVVDQAGQKHVVPGFVGHSLKDTIRRNNIFIPASCKGGDMVIKETENPVDPSRYGPSCSEC